jgi:hypothetical protein
MVKVVLVSTLYVVEVERLVEEGLTSQTIAISRYCTSA